MASLTLSVDEELKKRMKKHPEVKWSNVVRSVIRKQLDEWELADKIVAESKLSEKNIQQIAQKIDLKLFRHFEGKQRAARSRR